MLKWNEVIKSESFVVLVKLDLLLHKVFLFADILEYYGDMVRYLKSNYFVLGEFTKKINTIDKRWKRKYIDWSWACCNGMSGRVEGL